MKPYAAGWLFNRENASSIVLTPTQCISYALAQPGVCTVVPGCKNAAHVREALSYLNASDTEKDYGKVISGSKWDLKGSCMYCNHCLPCPAGINIAAVTRLADSAGKGISENMKVKYGGLASKGSDCLECGACMERCPFGVDVVSNMKRAVDLFDIN
jgi:predicted aldo/keto reductase-like oxidoreductase